MKNTAPMLPVSQSVKRDYFAKPSTTAPTILKRDNAWTNSAKEFLADIYDDVALLKDDLTLPPQFFELPRELRDEVYKHVWHDVILAFTDGGFTVIARGSHDYVNQPSTVLPSCTTVCRQMRIESIEQFHRSAVFSVGELRHLPAYIHQYPTKESGTMQVMVDDRFQPGFCYWQREVVTVLTISEVRAHPLSLRRAKYIHVSGILWGAHRVRANCIQPSASDCIMPCCAGNLDVSIAAGSDLDFGKLKSLLETDHDQRRCVTLIVKPSLPAWGPLYGGTSSLAIPRKMMLRQDFAFLDALPSYVREIRIDTGYCEGTPPDQRDHACAALTLVKSRCVEFNKSRRVP